MTMTETVMTAVSEVELANIKAQVEVELEKNLVSQNFINNLTKENVALAGMVNVLRKRLNAAYGIKPAQEISEPIKDDQANADSVPV